MSGLVLGIDTTGRGGTVALSDGREVLGVEAHDPALGYAEELFGLFDRLLERCGRRRGDLDAVAVVTGPGSFTGLRIGVMTAKALAFGLGLPLRGASTLELVAAASGPGRHRAVCEAGGGYVWTRVFVVGEHDLRDEGPAERIRLAELEAGPDLVSVASVGIGRAVEDLAGTLARLAAAGREPVRDLDPDALVPEYGGASQAERAHGVDLSEEISRPIEPRGWPT